MKKNSSNLNMWEFLALLANNIIVPTMPPESKIKDKTKKMVNICM
jgi:hypothetical protein